MQSHIFAALEKLGLSPQKRAIHVQFSNPALNTQVFLQRIDGEHLMNQGLSAELICLSTDALIPLKNFLGAQVAVDQVSDRGQLIRCFRERETLAEFDIPLAIGRELETVTGLAGGIELDQLAGELLRCGLRAGAGFCPFRTAHF